MDIFCVTDIFLRYRFFLRYLRPVWDTVCGAAVGTERRLTGKWNRTCWLPHQPITLKQKNYENVVMGIFRARPTILICIKKKKTLSKHIFHFPYFFIDLRVYITNLSLSNVESAVVSNLMHFCLLIRESPWRNPPSEGDPSTLNRAMKSFEDALTWSWIVSSP